jgi:hypothetical protein
MTQIVEKEKASGAKARPGDGMVVVDYGGPITLLCGHCYFAALEVCFSGIRLTRDSWNTNAITQKCTACPSLAAAVLEV